MTQLLRDVDHLLPAFDPSIETRALEDARDELLMSQGQLLSRIAERLDGVEVELRRQREEHEVLHEPLLHTIRSLSRWQRFLNPFDLSARLQPQLFVLWQHTPRPLIVPPRYRRAKPPANPPSISIVTPSFNQADYLRSTIASVLGQHYPRLEYIVQDGGSTDGSADIIRRFASRLTRWESQPDGGQANAINLGFAGTAGEIMGWLNSDDLLMPGALNYVASYFAKHPEVDVVYGHRYIINDRDQLIGKWLLPAHDDALLPWVDFVPQETLFWRREVWERAGGRIDENFDFALDWDLLLRLRAAGAKMVRLPRFLGAFRVTAQTKTSSKMATVGQDEVERLRERWLGFVPTHYELTQQTKRYLWRHMWRRLWHACGLLRD